MKVYQQRQRRPDRDLEAALAQVREAVRYGGARRIELVLDLEEGVVLDYRVERFSKHEPDWDGVMKRAPRRTL